jgi:hypothetical protein
MSPAGIKNAARLKLEAELAKQETYGRAVKIDPIEALLAEVHRAAGHVEWLGALIRQQAPEALVEETAVGRQTSALLRLYQQEREMLRRACESAIKAGVAERQVKIAEDQARMLAAAVQAVFNDPELGLTPQQRGLWPSLARRHLLALPGGEDTETP